MRPNLAEMQKSANAVGPFPARSAIRPIRPRRSRRFPVSAGGRAGFTFIELIVAMAIIAMIAATVVPVMVGALDRARVERGLESLEGLRDGLVAFEDDVNDWPYQLTQLTTQITTSNVNTCNQAHSNGEVGNWDGPYLTRLLSATGVQVFMGVADNQLIRYNLGGSSALLLIRVPGVIEEDILEADRQADASDGQIAGTIMWENPVDGVGNLYYVMAISGC